MSDMEEILIELQRMMEVNPEAYQKMMESMSKSLYSSSAYTGINDKGSGGSSTVRQNTIGQDNMSINQIAEAIMHMRNNKSDEMEGKKSDLIMSKDKPKQVINIFNADEYYLHNKLW